MDNNFMNSQQQPVANSININSQLGEVATTGLHTQLSSQEATNKGPLSSLR